MTRRPGARQRLAYLSAATWLLAVLLVGLLPGLQSHADAVLASWAVLGGVLTVAIGGDTVRPSGAARAAIGAATTTQETPDRPVG